MPKAETHFASRAARSVGVDPPRDPRKAGTRKPMQRRGKAGRKGKAGRRRGRPVEHPADVQLDAGQLDASAAAADVPADPAAARRPDNGRAALTALILAVLDSRERRVLAAYLFDGATQAEIADVEHRRQGTVSLWITTAKAKLRAAGVELPDENRADHANAGRIAFCEPAEIDRLTMKAGRGRWINSRKGSEHT
jgi:hypothetical protein